MLTQTLGFHHASIPSAIDAVRRVAARDGRYRVVFLPSASKLTPTALKGAAAVVFLLTTGELPLNPAEKHSLLAFVHDGGGLVGVDSATDTFHHWPGYIALIGAEFSHHPAPSTERLVVEDRTTLPLARSRRASRFTRSSTSSSTIRVPTSTCSCASTPAATARTAHSSGAGAVAPAASSMTPWATSYKVGATLVSLRSSRVGSPGRPVWPAPGAAEPSTILRGIALISSILGRPHGSRDRKEDLRPGGYLEVHEDWHTRQGHRSRGLPPTIDWRDVALGARHRAMRPWRAAPARDVASPHLLR